MAVQFPFLHSFLAPAQAESAKKAEPAEMPSESLAGVPEVVMRDQQLRMKSERKGARRDKIAKGKKGKGKKGKGKKGKGKKGVSRKRAMLKKKATADSWPDNDEVPGGKRKKSLPSSSSKAKPPAPKKKVLKSILKNKGEKKYADAMASEAGATGLKPTPAQEGKTRMKSTAKAKAKATAKAPKAKAAAPKAAGKGKGKGRGKGRSNDGSQVLSRMQENQLHDPSMVKLLKSFAESFDLNVWMDVKANAFKAHARGLAPTYENHRLTIYWTRCSAGVYSGERARDVVNFSFNTFSACDVYKIAVALKCAMESVT